MLTLVVRNVNDALKRGIDLFNDSKNEPLLREVSPRGKKTLEVICPVATSYERPRERVLFSAVRDANPFFHFFESLWVLAGRDDVAFVQQFNSRMGEFSDDGKVRHGAYGKRLRKPLQGMDGYPSQIELVVENLRKDPDSRQMVLQIWDWNLDLAKVSKDIPCNDLIFLLIRGGKLHMTVCCRSNDVVWGAYGSNAVEFSMLQEYLAAMIGVEVGVYTQVSNSYHVYVDRDDWPRLSQWYQVDDRYATQGVEPYPMVKVPGTWDAELARFLADPEGDLEAMQMPQFSPYRNPFFYDVAYPMWKSWESHKGAKAGWYRVKDCKAIDWRIACQEWLERRGDHA